MRKRAREEVRASIGIPPLPPPPTVDLGRGEIGSRATTPAKTRSLDDISRTYSFTIHHDLRPHRLFPFWATGCVGIGKFSGVWRARSHDRLVAKLTRFAKRDALSRGRADDPVVEVVDEQL